MPVTASPEQVLAELERNAQAEGARLDELDARVADALGVPRDYYFAYLLVRGAVEAHRDSLEPVGSAGPLPGDSHDEAGVLGCAESVTHRIGAQAAAIYRYAATDAKGSGVDRSHGSDLSGELAEASTAVLADHASRILASVVTLRQLLRDAQHARPPEPPAADAHVGPFEAAGVVRCG